MENLVWDADAQQKFDQLIEKIPVFLRKLAREKVSLRAEKLARLGKCTLISEKDLVDAFFAETPFGFQGPLKCDMEELGIDYTKYGYSK